MKAPRYLMRQQVTITEYKGTSGSGAPVYGAPYTQKCRFDGRRRLVRDAQGAEVVAEATVFLPWKQAEIPIKSKITFNGRQYTVIQCKPVYNISRLSHWEVALG